jgi:hypothetical protein
MPIIFFIKIHWALEIHLATGSRSCLAKPRDRKAWTQWQDWLDGSSEQTSPQTCMQPVQKLRCVRSGRGPLLWQCVVHSLVQQVYAYDLLQPSWPHVYICRFNRQHHSTDFYTDSSFSSCRTSEWLARAWYGRTGTTLAVSACTMVPYQHGVYAFFWGKMETSSASKCYLVTCPANRFCIVVHNQSWVKSRNHHLWPPEDYYNSITETHAFIVIQT